MFCTCSNSKANGAPLSSRGLWIFSKLGECLWWSYYVELRSNKIMLKSKHTGGRAIVATGLVEDIGHMRVYGTHTDVQYICDLLVAGSIGNQS